ncbi:hypothetical protein CAP36_03165 [Chitinophagaceae bacterium IBVUCB2]|nr:hypothetical protein CAP36_03165 [Chitinophagaceae bacterium IBVUCB2]
MKYFLLLLFLALNNCSFSQQQTFDITHFTPPQGWKKQNSESAIQLTKEDEAKGTYCMITLFKAVPGTTNSKENFDVAWTSVVKEMVTISTAPEMQPAIKENGWEAQSGYAPFESDGNKGVALLVTSSGFEKMVNIIILTNSDIYEKDITDFLGSIDFKTLSTDQPVKPTTQPVKSTTKADGFTFTTTNFDDGWNSTVQEDWVEATKGNIKVLIHYPNKKADAYNSVLLDGLKNAWDILVAPRYSSASNMEFKPVTGWQSIEFAEADMVEKDSRKKVYVVLFKMNYSNGSGKYLEFITPDKKTFEQAFGAYHQESYGWEKMEKMATYNKFAIAASDLSGKWTSDFSGAIQYVNANTGLDAGMDTHASAENFFMAANSTYKWDLGVASGQVGNIKFQSAKSTGRFSLPSNWQVKFSDISGKPRTYNAFFSCIKGLRILWLDDRPFAKAE